MDNRTMYDEVAAVLGYVSSYPEEEEELDESLDDEDLLIPVSLGSLGGAHHTERDSGSRKDVPGKHDPKEEWKTSTLSYMSQMASKASAVAASGISLLHLSEAVKKLGPGDKNAFSIKFHTKNIPFEYTTNSSGRVVVTHLYRDIDPRLHSGTCVLGLDQHLLPVCEDATNIFDKLLESVTVFPFSVTFELGAPQSEHVEAVYCEEDSGYSSHSSEEMDDLGDSRPRHEEQRHEELRHEASYLNSWKDRVLSIVGTPAEHNTQQSETMQMANVEQVSGHEITAPGGCSVFEDCFELSLTSRSPPFVFDLHADGRSIVVVKVISSSSQTSEYLQEGCVVRQCNGEPVVCASRSDFDHMLAAAQLPICLLLEFAPALYRHQDALSLYTAGVCEPLHVFTVLPSKITPPAQQKFFSAEPQAEDVFVTTKRAMQVLQAFRAQGVATALVSIETVLVNGNKAYSGMMDLRANSSVMRAIRVWFRFPEAVHITVESPADHLQALEVTDDGSQGSWIVIRCSANQSAWIDAGMVLGRSYLLTHVNNYDCSASSYRSVEKRVPGCGTWDDSVVPFFQRSKIQLTIV